MSIGPLEILLIMVIALVVIGPDRFPEFARIVMRTIRDLRSYVDDVKHDLSTELRPVKKEIDDLGRHNPQDYLDEVARAMSEAASSSQDASAPIEASAEESPPEEKAPDEPERLDG